MPFRVLGGAIETCHIVKFHTATPNGTGRSSTSLVCVRRILPWVSIVPAVEDEQSRMWCHGTLLPAHSQKRWQQASCTTQIVLHPCAPSWLPHVFNVNGLGYQENNIFMDLYYSSRAEASRAGSGPGYGIRHRSWKDRDRRRELPFSGSRKSYSITDRAAIVTI